MGVRRVLTALFTLLVVGGVLAARTVRRHPDPASPNTARTASLPLMFEPSADGEGFAARSRGYSVRVSGAGARFVTRGEDRMAVALRFAGGGGDLRPERR